jgi:trehalose-phosphatase
LTPIVEHPSLAVLPDDTRQVLHRLASRHGVSVGVLSGRGLIDVRHMVAIPGLYYAGNSGLELDLLGRRVVYPEAERHRRVVAQTVRCLEEVARRYPDAWVEDKGLGLTLHYRQVPAGRLEGLWEQAGRVLHPYTGVLRVVDGPMAWEVTPALIWDKGTALRQIVDAVGGPTLVLYAGDLDNDSSALEAANALGGASIGVGARAPCCAQHRMGEPAELISFLFALDRALGELHSPMRVSERNGAALSVAHSPVMEGA